MPKTAQLSEIKVVLPQIGDEVQIHVWKKCSNMIKDNVIMSYGSDVPVLNEFVIKTTYKTENSPSLFY